jgi:hypothetical protein
MKMMKWMTIAVAAMMAVAAVAQEAGPQPGQGGQRGNRQQGQGGQRGGMMANQNQANPMEGSGFAVLARADVQTELKMTETQKADVTKLQQSYMASMRERLTQARQNGEDIATIRTQMDATLGTEIKKILDDAQEVRFMEIRIQIAGIRAVVAPEIQTKLKLEQGQRSKIAGAKTTFEKATAAIQAGIRNQTIDREDAQPQMQEAGKKLDADLSAILTPENLAALKELGGKEFAGAKRQQGGNRQGGGRQPGGQGAAGGGAGNGGGATGGDFGPQF